MGKTHPFSQHTVYHKAGNSARKKAKELKKFTKSKKAAIRLFPFGTCPAGEIRVE
jgi:hypothetical protein